MNYSLDLKKIGNIIILIASAIICLGSFSILMQYNSVYGTVSGAIEYVAIDFIGLGGTYYFCSKDFNVSSMFAYRSACRGPLLGFGYLVLCFNFVQIGLLHIALAVGYILVTIHNVQLVKSDRDQRKEQKKQTS